MSQLHFGRNLLCVIFITSPVVSSQCSADSYEFLAELNEEFFILDENRSVDAGTFGIHIFSLNTATIDDDLIQKALPFSSREDFREALCEKLTTPETCCCAYALLNQLYPEHTCRIVADSFWLGQPADGTSVPIIVLASDEVVHLRVSISAFGEICRRYWRKKLHLRSNTEKVLDETRPGWRKELGIPESDYSKVKSPEDSNAHIILPDCSQRLKPRMVCPSKR